MPPVPPVPSTHGRRPRRTGFLLSGLLGVVAVLLAWGLATRRAPPPGPGEAAVAHVAERSGAVMLHRTRDAGAPGPGLALSVGDGLLVGDIIATGPDGTARLRFRDGKELVVSENTRFLLEGSPRALRLLLEQGSVLSRGSQGGTEAPGLSLTVLTPQGAAAVTEGSEVAFSLSPERSGLRVLLGELTLIEAGGAQRRVLAGEALELTLGRRGAESGEGPAQEARDTPLKLRLSAQRGTPMVRVSGADRFTPVPRKPIPVEEGARVRVPARASALLAGPSLRARLSGGSAGAVGRATGSPEGDAYALALEAGAAELDFQAGGKRRLTLFGRGRTMDVAVEEETSAAVVQGPGGTVLEVRAGQAEVSAGGEARTVRAGEVADLKGLKLEVRPRPAPALVLPARGSLRVHANGLQEVGLALGQESGPEARVEVATDAAFSERVLAGRTGPGHVVVPVPATGALHWRTLGVDGAVLARGEARFLADSAQGDGPPPRAEIAETGQRAFVYFQGAPPSLVLTSAPHAGAHAYRVRVYREGELGTPVLERVVASPKAELEAGALGEGRYLWHALPLDARGVELMGGRMNRLELIYDNARRTLALFRPRPGERVGRRGVEVQGVAPLGARLSLDGRPVPLDAKGRFHLRAAPAEALVFHLVSADGSEAYWVRSLKGTRGAR